MQVAEFSGNNTSKIQSNAEIIFFPSTVRQRYCGLLLDMTVWSTHRLDGTGQLFGLVGEAERDVQVGAQDHGDGGLPLVLLVVFQGVRLLHLRAVV